MTTSGSIDFSLTRDDLIKAALRLCLAIPSGEPIEASDISEASQALNIMVKSWMAVDVGLWAHQECTLFLNPGQRQYRLGTATGAAHCTASHEETTTTADELISSTVIELTSTSGMTAGDFIGIIMDSGTIHWDIIVSVDSLTQVTITTGLAAAASSGAVVYSYTSKIGRPLKILESRHRGASALVGGDGTDIPLDMLSRTDYQFLSVKNAQGVTTQAYYDPQLSLGILNVWPVPGSAKETIRMTIQRTLEDMDAINDTFDFPQEWFRALKYNLAVDIGPEYDVPLDKLAWMGAKAQQYLDEAKGFDTESASFKPQPSGYY